MEYKEPSVRITVESNLKFKKNYFYKYTAEFQNTRQK